MSHISVAELTVSLILGPGLGDLAGSAPNVCPHSNIETNRENEAKGFVPDDLTDKAMQVTGLSQLLLLNFLSTV